MSTLPTVSFITVNYNQTQLTLELLESIYRYADVPFEIIVVDNASNENPTTTISRIYPDVRVIVSGVNRGFAGGNNLGVAVSRGSFLFFINNDAVLTEGALQRMLDAFDDPTVGVVSPLICYYPATSQEVDVIQYAGATEVHPLTGRNAIIGEGQPDQSQYCQSKPTFYAHGAAMMVRREIGERVGLMTEGYFLYYEELDWCERIRRAGYQILVEPRAKIYHKESVSTGSSSPLKIFYLNRNRIAFMRRHRSATAYRAFSWFCWLATVPKNSLQYAFKGRWDLLRAFWRAIRWNYGDNADRRAFDQEAIFYLEPLPRPATVVEG